MHTTRDVWTVGDLSRRTGIPIKAVRDYTDQGLVNTLGRSRAGYRTYSRDALRCLQLITTLRGLGLTLAEIRELTRIPAHTAGPRVSALLAASKHRTQDRIAALHAVLERIDRFERDYSAELTGRQPLWAGDAECACESARPSPRVRPYRRLRSHADSPSTVQRGAIVDDRQHRRSRTDRGTAGPLGI